MLATLIDADQFGDEDGWAFEMKWDGVRAVAYLAGGRVKLLSRKGRDDTAAYSDVADDLPAITVDTAVLDGEVVVTDATGTAELRPAAEPDQPHPAGRHRARGADLAGPADALRHPRAERPVVDQAAVRGAPRDPRGSGAPAPRITGPGAADLRRRPRRRDGDQRGASSWKAWWPSAATRSTSRAAAAQTWLKIKTHQTQEVVIGGWRPGQGPPRRRRRVAADGRARPPKGCTTSAGSGPGSTIASSTRSRRSSSSSARKTSPLIDVPREDARDAHWVTPSLVGEVHLRRTHRPGPVAAPGLARAADGQGRRRGGLGASAGRLKRRSDHFSASHRVLPRRRWIC